MTEPTNTNPNPIEDALGQRAKAQFRQEAQSIQIPEDLEALNRRTEMEYKDDVPEESMTEIPIVNHKGETVNVPQAPFPVPSKDIQAQRGAEKEMEETETIVEKILALTPDLPPVTTASSPESQPPQNNSLSVGFKGVIPMTGLEETEAHILHVTNVDEKNKTMTVSPRNDFLEPVNMKMAPKQSWVCDICGEVVTNDSGKPEICAIHKHNPIDKEFDAAKKYLFDNGFNESAVAMHITVICASPLVAPDTNSWTTPLRHKIPALVYETLKKPGYLEGIWPSLKIVMGSNTGNAVWAVGVAITIAFFDVIKMLPVLGGKDANS